LYLQLGASISLADNEGLWPLDIAQRDRKKYVEENLGVSDEEFSMKTNPTELFVWGSNDNYNLGIGSQSGRLYPEVLDEAKTFVSPHSTKPQPVQYVRDI